MVILVKHKGLRVKLFPNQGEAMTGLKLKYWHCDNNIVTLNEHLSKQQRLARTDVTELFGHCGKNTRGLNCFGVIVIG